MQPQPAQAPEIPGNPSNQMMPEPEINQNIPNFPGEEPMPMEQPMEQPA